MSRRRNRRRRNQPNSQPAKRQADDVSPTSVEITAASWRGPLPPPDTLRQYNEVVPGAALRILNMAEQQSNHRIQMEKAVVSGDSRRSYVGILAAFILSAMVIVGGIYLIVNGHDWAGATLIGLDLVGLAGVFVYGTNARRAERALKAGRAPRIEE